MPSGEEVEIAERADLLLFSAAPPARTFLLFVTGLPLSFRQPRCGVAGKIQVIHLPRFLGFASLASKESNVGLVQLCVPKTKSERIDDGVHPEWRASS